MLYVQEKVVKLGGVYLGGQVTSVEIQEAGSVYVVLGFLPIFFNAVRLTTSKVSGRFFTTSQFSGTNP